MTELADNPQAFPCPTHIAHSGMTLRDWFAGQLAPVAFATDHGNEWGQSGVRHRQIAAETAYDWADAMLAARAAALRAGDTDAD